MLKAVWCALLSLLTGAALLWWLGGVAEPLIGLAIVTWALAVGTDVGTLDRFVKRCLVCRCQRDTGRNP